MTYRDLGCADHRTTLLSLVSGPSSGALLPPSLTSPRPCSALAVPAAVGVLDPLRTSGKRESRRPPFVYYSAVTPVDFSAGLSSVVLLRRFYVH